LRELTNAFPQANLSFRQLSVNDGLSQNSAVSIKTQDQDAVPLDRYSGGTESIHGRGFVVFDKKISRHHRVGLVFCLGKYLPNSENRIWIIPESSIPELF